MASDLLCVLSYLTPFFAQKATFWIAVTRHGGYFASNYRGTPDDQVAWGTPTGYTSHNSVICGTTFCT